MVNRKTCANSSSECGTDERLIIKTTIALVASLVLDCHGFGLSSPAILASTKMLNPCVWLQHGAGNTVKKPICRIRKNYTRELFRVSKRYVK